jgi:hypothetical protein
VGLEGGLDVATNYCMEPPLRGRRKGVWVSRCAFESNPYLLACVPIYFNDTMDYSASSVKRGVARKGRVSSSSLGAHASLFEVRGSDRLLPLLYSPRPRFELITLVLFGDA